jgi:hypothetical protein
LLKNVQIRLNGGISYQTFDELHYSPVRSIIRHWV